VELEKPPNLGISYRSIILLFDQIFEIHMFQPLVNTRDNQLKSPQNTFFDTLSLTKIKLRIYLSQIDILEQCC